MCFEPELIVDLKNPAVEFDLIIHTKCFIYKLIIHIIIIVVDSFTVFLDVCLCDFECNTPIAVFFGRIHTFRLTKENYLVE
jgi:hypothetical protein